MSLHSAVHEHHGGPPGRLRTTLGARNTQPTGQCEDSENYNYRTNTTHEKK